jgi:CysZ protein
VGLLVVALALALGAYVVLNGILCGHYHGRLAERLERELGLAPEAIRQISLRYQVTDAFGDLGFLTRVNAALLLLHLVPGVGTLAAAAGSLYFTALTLGSDYLDFPLALRGMRRAEKRAFIRGHRPHALGLGAAVLLLALVPVLGSFVLATAAAGAVLLHRRLTGVPEA